MSGKPGIIDLSTLRARDYSKCLLKRNPFPSTAIPEEVPLITVDRESLIKHLQNVIVDLTENSSTTVSVMVGRYGSGKSHLLRVFKNSVNAQLLQLEEAILAIYVRSPGSNFRDFFLYLMEDLGRGFLIEYARKYLGNLVRTSKPSFQRFVFDKAVSKRLIEDSVELDELLTSMRALDFFRFLRESHFQKLGISDVVYSFLSLAHPNYSSLAWRWFSGEGLNRDEKKLLQVENNIDDPRTAYNVLRDLIGLLHTIGMGSIVLLVDELERVVLVSGLQRSQFQDHLRHFIDDNPRGMAFFFAISPPQWEKLTKEPSALTRRLIGNVHRLDLFDRQRTYALISEYLKWSRVENFSNDRSRKLFPEAEPVIAPFTLPSITRIMKVTKGNVSDVILLCRKCLEYLVDRFDEYGAVTSALVDLVASQEGFSK